MNIDDFQMYYADTTHNHIDLGTIQIFGYNTDDEYISYSAIGSDQSGKCHQSIDEFRSNLSQPKLNHYAHNKSVLWPFQKGDRYYKKGLHSERIYDVPLTTRLEKNFPTTHDKIRDIIMQRERTTLRGIKEHLNETGMVCISTDKLDHVCILNESDGPIKSPDFYFGPRKIEDDVLFGMVKFFTGRPHDIVLQIGSEAPPSALSRYHVLLRDKLIHTLRSKTLNDTGEEILLNLVSGFYDASIIAGVDDEMLNDIKDFFHPPEPKVTTKCFYKSIHLLDIGGDINEDLRDIPFFNEMMYTINKEYC